MSNMGWNRLRDNRSRWARLVISYFDLKNSSSG